MTLKSGCLLTTTKIGTNEIEMRIETNMNSEAVSGSAIFKKSCPNALPAILISMAGSALGQLFLNIADPETASLFMLVSILISISLVPILVVVSKQPDFSVIEFLSIKELYKASPLGVVAAMLTGLAHERDQ